MTVPRNWAEISLTALRHNYVAIRDLVAPHATVCAIVKANAYGHGAAHCARTLEQEGAKWFGVTTAEEGIELRQAGISGRILLMSGFSPGEKRDLLEHNLTPVIWDARQLELLEHAAKDGHPPVASVNVHLKVDTGMSRLGSSMSELPALLQRLKSAKITKLEGVLTHLASSEVVDAPDVEAQLRLFDQVIGTVAESGLSPVYYHTANSAAIVTRDRTWKNLVRPGISPYGYCLPLRRVSGTRDTSRELPVVPVLSWKTRIIAIRDVSAQQPVGYNGGYITQAPSRLAVLPVGYADGFRRSLSSRGRVIVRGEYANVVGNVSMDLTTIDITRIPGVEVGDEVILIGESGKCKITAWEHASHASTIPYEILCGIASRVPRVYVE